MRDVFRSPLRVFCRGDFAGRKNFAAVRPSLALAFALLVALAPLAGVVRAQVASKPGGPQYSVAEDSPTYVIYQTPSGETGCRAATPAEIESLRGDRDAGLGLRQINHLGGKGAVETDAVSAGLTIVLRGTAQLEANPAAKQAFIAAAAKWEAIISNQITVVIDVDYGPELFGTPYSSPNVLGATSTSGFLVSYSTVRQRLVNRAPAGSEEAAIISTLPASSLPTDIGNVSTVFVPPPIMRALGILGPTPDSDTQPAPVPRIGFNSAFSFDFDPTNGVASNQTDFDSVAVHEIGHALGFNSQTGARELDPTRTLSATIWDFYRFRPSAGTSANFSIAQRVLSSGTSFSDPHVHFSGGAEIALSTGKPDGTGGDDEQASHWKDDAHGVLHIGIMDPTLPRGRHEVITANDLKAIDFFGYSVGSVTAPTAPANDNFAAAQSLSGSSGRITGTNSNATKEAGEPSHSPDGNTGGKSVWYNWTAPASGAVTFTTGVSALGGSSVFDTLLAAYTGSSVGALSSIIKNDDSGETGVVTSSIQFDAVGGTTYRIAVDGWNADEGSIALSWNQAAVTPAVVRFDSPIFYASEADGNAVIRVSRYIGGSGPFTVNYATSDGTATAPSDYTPVSGTLSFAAGETTKTFNVPVNNDAGDEANESVNLTLIAGAGAQLGTPAAVTLSILDDDDSVGTQDAVISFNAPSYTFSETVMSAALALTRTGNPSATVTVNVRTVDNVAAVGCGDITTLPGVAFARCDYATTIDTITFAPGEMTKNVSVPLIDDAHGEPSETVQLVLSSPSAGAQLGSQSAASLVITSNEAQGQTGAVNPINNNAFFVRQHYLDFLSREPEVGEPWTGVLSNCPDVNNNPACDRLTVSAAFFGAPEFDMKGRYVFRFYKVTFGRLPEYAEIVADMRKVSGATGPEVIAKRAAFPGEWVQRADFKTAFDSKSNAEFVNTIMDRYGLLLVTTFHPSSPEGGTKVQLSRTGMAAALNNGQWTRAQVVRAIADSDEVGRAEFNPSFVAMQYYGYLRRTPEPGGYANWLTYLNANPNDSRTMVGGFVNSVEYRLRFGGQ